MTQQTTWNPELGGHATLWGEPDSMAGATFHNPQGLLGINQDLVDGKACGMDVTNGTPDPIGGVVIYPDGSAMCLAHIRKDHDHILEWMERNSQKVVEYGRDQMARILIEGQDIGRKLEHAQWRLGWELGTASREQKRRLGPPQEQEE